MNGKDPSTPSRNRRPASRTWTALGPGEPVPEQRLGSTDCQSSPQPQPSTPPYECQVCRFGTVVLCTGRFFSHAVCACCSSPDPISNPELECHTVSIYNASARRTQRGQRGIRWSSHRGLSRRQLPDFYGRALRGRQVERRERGLPPVPMSEWIAEVLYSHADPDPDGVRGDGGDEQETSCL